MELDRETILEAGVAIVTVGAFIIALVFIGVSFDDRGLSDQGGLALVVAIVAFIFVMTGIGYWLSSRET